MGWGNGFCGNNNTETLSSLEPDTPCFNTAISGATTGTFVADGYWNISVATIKTEVAKGRRTLVTIQFGHNDQKIAPPESMGKNLTEMVQQIRALKAEPVLVTSLTRRNFFANGTLDDILGPWADETILISQQQKTHLLDLHAASVKYVEEIGEDAAHRLNGTPDDNTHLNKNGTIVFGRWVARVTFNARAVLKFGLRRMVADLLNASFPNQLPIIANPELTFNITHGIPSY
ncbi:hypothetical protein D9758_014506 [Tetrapyrgos nigripes]|uniref:SGNH hydrolase-type esterase domain-containing protein n=1 Tax=Tetrapyrgos nigripes TaxID=182062 RepID=A0A8H5FSK4_9AGAR|nr:hypothetical protein D9758_014506 [Tetrapyrgos nigripes]